MTADLLISGGTLVTPDGLRPGSLMVRGGRIHAVLPPGERPEVHDTIDATGLHVLPGAIDIHCHIRSPAYPQRGTVLSETAACAKGGITAVFEMPITDPCCNSPDRVIVRRDHFAQTALVDFGLYAAPVELTEAAFRALAACGIVALKIFTTPSPAGREHEFAGLAWPDAAAQARILELAARTGLLVVVHAEQPEILAAAESAARALDPADAATHNAARPPMAEALALRLVQGADIPVSEFDAFCRRYAELEPLLGAPLAVVELQGDPATARAAIRAGAGDTDAAWQHVWGRPEVVEGVKFLSWRDRYAKRDSARAPD